MAYSIGYIIYGLPLTEAASEKIDSWCEGIFNPVLKELAGGDETIHIVWGSS